MVTPLSISKLEYTKSIMPQRDALNRKTTLLELLVSNKINKTRKHTEKQQREGCRRELCPLFSHPNVLTEE